MRTGPDFHEAHVLKDGTRVQLRHIRPSDAAELRRAFERLSARSVYRRFFGVTRLSDEMVRYLTEVDGTSHVAIIALVESPDLKTEQGIGVARFVRLRDEPDVAEAAVTVVDDYQNRGLARLLAEVLAEAARERGIARFRSEVLADNDPMRHLIKEMPASFVKQDGDVVVFEVPLERPRAAMERVLRAVAASMATFIQRHLLPPPPPRAKKDPQ